MRKLYYSIGEVCEALGEEAHVLRYWEKEFDRLKPKKNRGGNRIYSSADLELLKRIKSFLRDEKLSLRGAKEKLEHEFPGGKAKNKSDEPPPTSQSILVEEPSGAISHGELKRELKELMNEILNYLKK